jgi:hypothetical protein
LFLPPILFEVKHASLPLQAGAADAILRAGTNMAARAAIVLIVRKVDLATIRIQSVAVGETGITGCNRATATGTRRGAIGDRADVTARSAVVDVAVRIDLAAVGIIVVTICEPGIARSHMAGAGNATLCPIGHGGTEVAARAAIVEVIAGVDFATVGGIVVAIGIAGIAGRHQAIPRGATRGAIGDRTDVPARAAVAGVAVYIDFAAISRTAIAIQKAGIAGCDRTVPAAASWRAIRHRAANVSAGAAITDIAIDVDFAAVRWVPITIGISRIANDPAIAAGAGCGGIRLYRAGIPASAAVGGIGRGDHTCARAFRLATRTRGGEIRPGIAVGKRRAWAEINLAIIIIGHDIEVDPDVPPRTVLDDQIADPIGLVSAAVVEIGQVAFDPVRRARGVDSGRGAPVPVRFAGVVLNKAGGADENAVVQIGAGDAIGDAARFTGVDARDAIAGERTVVDRPAGPRHESVAAIIADAQSLKLRIPRAGRADSVAAPTAHGPIVEREVLDGGIHEHAMQRAGHTHQRKPIEIECDIVRLDGDAALARSTGQIAHEII